MPLARALARLGRLGTKAVAASLLAGLALPGVAELARPLLVPGVVVLLTLAFMRVPGDRLRAALMRPRPAFAACAVLMLALPGIVAAALYGTGLAALWPELALGIFLMSVAPPVASAPAIAAILRIDAPLSLALLILCAAVTPVTAPIFVALALDGGFRLDPVALGWRLFAVMGSAAALALLARRLIGAGRIAAHSEVLDGLSVILLFVLVLALLGDAAYLFLADPPRVALIVALTFLVAILVGAAAGLALAWLGGVRALTVALAASSRNMAVMGAVAGPALPADAWLWFALGQFPIFLLPLMAGPLARAALRGEEGASSEDARKAAE